MKTIVYQGLLTSPKESRPYVYVNLQTLASEVYEKMHQALEQYSGQTLPKLVEDFVLDRKHTVYFEDGSSIKIDGDTLRRLTNEVLI